MKLKLDANGVPELKDGRPVYVHDDGKEFADDVPALFSKISALNEEAKNDHREEYPGDNGIRFESAAGAADPYAQE